MDEAIPGFDLDATLKVARDAPPEVISAAYRALIRRAHPDVRHVEGAVVTAQRLNLAREWLIDPERRARYDSWRGAIRVRATRPAVSRRRTPQQPTPDEADIQRAVSDLEAWIARCNRLTQGEAARLGRAYARSRREPVVSRGEAAEVLATAELHGRLGIADRAFAQVVAERGPLRSAAPELILDLHSTACAIALRSIRPLQAEALVAPWHEVIDRADASAERSARRREIAKARLGRAAGLLGLTAVALIATVGLLAAIALLFAR